MIRLISNEEEIFVNPTQISYMKRGDNFKTVLYFGERGVVVGEGIDWILKEIAAKKD